MTLRTTNPDTITSVLKCISTKNRIADPMFSPNRFLFDDTTSYVQRTCAENATSITHGDYAGLLESLFNDFKL